VVVINFLNQRNAADQRVLELLQDKFHLFDGVFGASDQVWARSKAASTLKSASPRSTTVAAPRPPSKPPFATLRTELEADIQARMAQTEQALLEHFDADIHDLLRSQKERAESQLDRITRYFWWLTQYCAGRTRPFRPTKLAFDLQVPPAAGARWRLPAHPQGRNTARPRPHLPADPPPGPIRARHAAVTWKRPLQSLTFHYGSHKPRISMVERLAGQSGWMQLSLLELDSFQREEHLVFTAITDTGEVLDQESCEKLFYLLATTAAASQPARQSCKATPSVSWKPRSAAPWSSTTSSSSKSATSSKPGPKTASPPPNRPSKTPSSSSRA
jgi:hypothetical protein